MAKRVDANQAEIVEALRAGGCVVQSLATVGHGVPDLLVARAGRWYVMEVKDGSKPLSKRRLTPDEAAWHARFGRHAVVSVVETVEDALAAVQETKP